eukprot:Hpha_TRINITY_DN36271_c0_g1::TRINITY_DN36271_c0_g1_i1::g.83189::m.83189
MSLEEEVEQEEEGEWSPRTELAKNFAGMLKETYTSVVHPLEKAAAEKSDSAKRLTTARLVVASFAHGQDKDARHIALLRSIFNKMGADGFVAAVEGLTPKVVKGAVDDYIPEPAPVAPQPPPLPGLQGGAVGKSTTPPPPRPLS